MGRCSSSILHNTPWCRVYCPHCIKERTLRHRLKPRQSSLEPLSLATQIIAHFDTLKKYFACRSNLCLAYLCFILWITWHEHWKYKSEASVLKILMQQLCSQAHELMFLRSTQGTFVISQVLEILFQIMVPYSEPAVVASLQNTSVSLMSMPSPHTHFKNPAPKGKAQLSFGLQQSFISSHVFFGDTGQGEHSLIHLLNEPKPRHT